MYTNNLSNPIKTNFFNKEYTFYTVYCACLNSWIFLNLKTGIDKIKIGYWYTNEIKATVFTHVR